MLTSNRLANLQAKRSARLVGVESAEKDEQAIILECRRYIQQFSEFYRNMAPAQKKEIIKEKINLYVMNELPIVNGYTDDDNRPDTNKLTEMLIEEIMDYGILTEAMRDPNIYEIRANGKGIKIEINGRITDLTDNEGRIIEFSTVEQQETILRKLLGDVRLNPKYRLVNARTIEGYRIAAVHSSGMSLDPNNPLAEQYHSFVIRKFREVKMNLSDIVRYGTLSDDMAELLELLPQAELTFVTVGPTTSGKTTTNNAILLSGVSPNLRTIIIQNPSEIDLRMRDAAGRIYNDTLHLEASEKDNPSAYDNTMVNLMSHLLRMSPTLVCFGELRSNKEFKLGMAILQAGHPVNTTYHADSSESAVKRFLTAYLAESGNEPAHLALSALTEVLHIIIVQRVMRDGRRKIIQISEVIGVKNDNPNEPDINDLYRFEIDQEPEYDEYNRLIEIKGTHKHVGVLSEKIIRKFSLCGIPRYKWEKFTELDDEYTETYTGNYKSNIRDDRVNIYE